MASLASEEAYSVNGSTMEKKTQSSESHRDFCA